MKKSLLLFLILFIGFTSGQEKFLDISCYPQWEAKIKNGVIPFSGGTASFIKPLTGDKKYIITAAHVFPGDTSKIHELNIRFGYQIKECGGCDLYDSIDVKCLVKPLSVVDTVFFEKDTTILDFALFELVGMKTGGFQKIEIDITELGWSILEDKPKLSECAIVGYSAEKGNQLPLKIAFLQENFEWLYNTIRFKNLNGAIAFGNSGSPFLWNDKIIGIYNGTYLDYEGATWFGKIWPFVKKYLNPENEKLFYTASRKSLLEVKPEIGIKNLNISNDSGKVKITFESLDEKNIKEYVIGCRGEKSDWIPVHNFKAKSGKEKYEFAHKPRFQGTNFYRIDLWDKKSSHLGNTKPMRVEYQPSYDNQTESSFIPKRMFVTVNFRYSIPEESNVKLSIYDSFGSLVDVALDEKKEAGIHNVIFRKGNLLPGTYYYKLETNRSVKTRKLVILK